MQDNFCKISVNWLVFLQKSDIIILLVSKQENKMKKNRLINYKEIDYILVVITTICVVFGLFAIHSAVKAMDNGSTYVIIQLCAAAIGAVGALIITAINYEYFKNLTKPIYILCVIMLLAVLVIGTGREDTGSRSWIRFGPIGIQPSEFVKIGFIITFSKTVAELGDKLNKPKNILKLLIHAGVFMFLIMLQPDFGTTMVFIMIFAGILFAAKISWKYILGTGVLVAGAIPLIWNFFLADYQKNRIRVLFDPESDPLGAGYHVMQSKTAIGSGGIIGAGIGKGTQTQFGYLPAKHTDFIYSVIGEELGFIGCIVVAVLLFALVLRCLYIAKNAKSNFGSYICVGVACMFLAHTFENIGMCVGLMPVTGIPLPFFSYGGSSILTNMMAIGLMLSVRTRQKEIRFEI
ncbi:MAG: rod shape-determining protein RodA [Ruminococcaceae bacterium]|nr:rod shape-determining protein RodA [Oscillospiraceae bacterium]